MITIDRHNLTTRAPMSLRNMRGLAGWCAAILVAAAVAVAACDTDVTNPGPVQDKFLADSAAQPALVNGMGRALAQAVNWIAYTGAAVTREVHPSGSTGSFGITNRWQQGELAPDDGDLDTHWEQAQQARWLAEHGIGRIEENPTSQAVLAQAYLWAGYSNRLLGENMCQAVIDGGEPAAHTEFLTRAVNWFTKAAETGSGDVRTAAIAGRASARASLGQWSEAASDAGQVQTDFVYRLPFYDVGEDAQRNRIYWASAGQPYRAHTLWNTVYEEYVAETGDPRTPFRVTNEEGDAAIECCDKVPWNPQEKHSNSAAPINLSSGAEMRLIEAENRLRQNEVTGAMALINALRRDAGVVERSAANAEEAWTHLKRERGIVLWLEGRRLGDLRRWSESNTPGALHPLEQPSGSVADGSHLVRQDLCIPIPPTEQDTNPNVQRAG